MTASILAIIGGIVTLAVTGLTWWIKTQPDRIRQRRLAIIQQMEKDLAYALAKNDMVAVAVLNNRLELIRKES